MKPSIDRMRAALCAVVVISTGGSFGGASAAEPVPTRLQSGGWYGSTTVSQGDTLLDLTLGGGVTLLETATDRPLPGKVITFTTGGRVVCTATTDEFGAAGCGGDASTAAARDVAQDGFEATFAGDENHLASSVGGGLFEVHQGAPG